MHKTQWFCAMRSLGSDKIANVHWNSILRVTHKKSLFLSRFNQFFLISLLLWCNREIHSEIKIAHNLGNVLLSIRLLYILNFTYCWLLMIKIKCYVYESYSHCITAVFKIHFSPDVVGCSNPQGYVNFITWENILLRH